MDKMNWKRATHRRRIAGFAPLWGIVALAATTACGNPGAYGDANRIIVGADPDLWAEIEDTVYSALEPRIFTVRNERAFELTHQDPEAVGWGNMKRFKQELLIGTEDDPWVAEAMRKVEQVNSAGAPAIFQAQNVWARNQLVTILLLPPGGRARAVKSLLPSLGALLDEQYRDYVLRRMYTSGRDTALAESLAERFGFSLELANVYRWEIADSVNNSVHIFRNDNPDPSELIRQVTVAWRAADPAVLGPDSLVAWRTRIGDRHFNHRQVTETKHLRESREDFGDNRAVEVRATWVNHPEDEFPAGGPLVTRGILCESQDRVYLVDAWLYAPGRDKYEYMIQLETILASFRCDR